ncbi:MAG: phosphatase PAP2 family protein [Chloroherpetonaceae bacterium]|nr:phosphatase PAP2 family protein [Chloroherpetonaceae bacterium]
MLEVIGATRPSRLLLFAVLGAAVLLLPLFSKYFSEKARYFAPMFFVPILFTETLGIIPTIIPYTVDDLLIHWDFELFGQHATHWAYQFENPFVTEYLQILYVTFFFLPFPIVIYLVSKEKRQEAENTVFSIVYAFFVSYVGYFFMPARGPRFTLHDISQIDQELPGVWIAESVRNLLHQLEGYVALDCFPSGHTDITLVTLFMAWKYRKSIFLMVFPIGVSIIISTIYLRYHYAVDLIAGVIFFVFTIWSAPYAQSFFKDQTEFLQNFIESKLPLVFQKEIRNDKASKILP